ncbi:MAG: alpha,alpha-trehalase [Bacteroidales bacterium]|nr:alpha,alpha-trehalase [Bacteroidales bacterium]
MTISHRLVLLTLLLSIPGLNAYASPGSLDRQRLPEPVYSLEPGYVELYWKAWELAWDHIEVDDGMVQSPFMDEAWYDRNTGKDGRIWIWDTEFMALFCKYAPDVFPGIQSLDNFYGPILDSLPSSQIIHHPDNPAFFPWVEWEYYQFTGDKARIDTLITVKGYLPRFYDYYRSIKRGSRFPFTDQKVKLEFKDIGFVWGGDQSGMDNSPRKDKGSILWVDALGQQALAALYIWKLAAEVGNKEVEKRFRREYRLLRKLLNRYYWDRQDACYYDIFEDNHSFTHTLTPASFWPVLAQVPSRCNARKMAEYALAPERLGGERPWKSVSASDPAFVADGGQYWRGGIWLPTAYMGIKALESYGIQDLADWTSAALLREMLSVYRDFDPHTIWECYDPSADKPALDKKGAIVRKDFCGWSALGPISLFIENVIGIREVDAGKKLVRWDIIRKEGSVGLKRLCFGGIRTDLLCQDGTVTIISDGPYTLILNGKRIHIPSGETSFALQ